MLLDLQPVAVEIHCHHRNDCEDKRLHVIFLAKVPLAIIAMVRTLSFITVDPPSVRRLLFANWYMARKAQ